MVKKYFPNLDALRFLAAVAVIFHHVDQVAVALKLKPYQSIPWVVAIGPLAVNFFLTLSGFLITYFLLIELQENQVIDYRLFYQKRKLRILPLYFLVIFCGLFIFPRLCYFKIIQEAYQKQFGFLVIRYLFLLPNLIIFPPVWGISHAWVVGLEEQFYFFWPKMVAFFKKKLIYFSILIICLKFMVKKILVGTIFSEFIDYFQIESILIGGIFAFLVCFQPLAFWRKIFSPLMQVCVLCLIGIFISPWKIYFYFLPGFHLIEVLFISCLWGIIIVNWGINPQPIINIDCPVLNFLGKLSYGFYLWHMMIIFLWIEILQKTAINGIIFFYLTYFGSLIWTFLVAALSYFGFEAFFLRKKATLESNRHAKIKKNAVFNSKFFLNN